MASEDGGLPRLEIVPEWDEVSDPDNPNLVPVLTLASVPLSEERRERMEVADACFERGWSLTIDPNVYINHLWPALHPEIDGPTYLVVRGTVTMVPRRATPREAFFDALTEDLKDTKHSLTHLHRPTHESDPAWQAAVNRQLDEEEVRLRTKVVALEAEITAWTAATTPTTGGDDGK